MRVSLEIAQLAAVDADEEERCDADKAMSDESSCICVHHRAPPHRRCSNSSRLETPLG